ncbi:MAG TPA: hypothetical protein VJT31_01560 [Rugosimonospora sp.]|nr:hypothetical protein [Rugosimonospora sp.]
MTLSKETTALTTHPTTNSSNDKHPSSIFQNLTARAGPTSTRVRVAFLARVSTDDKQDPTLSLPRQYAKGRYEIYLVDFVPDVLFGGTAGIGPEWMV